MVSVVEWGILLVSRITVLKYIVLVLKEDSVASFVMREGQSNELSNGQTLFFEESTEI